MPHHASAVSELEGYTSWAFFKKKEKKKHLGHVRSCEWSMGIFVHVQFSKCLFFLGWLHPISSVLNYWNYEMHPVPDAVAKVICPFCTLMFGCPVLIYFLFGLRSDLNWRACALATKNYLTRCQRQHAYCAGKLSHAVPKTTCILPYCLIQYACCVCFKEEKEKQACNLLIILD